MSPDELLLTLIDLVTLAFPEPLYEMTITFVPNEDGARPALTNLDGKARPNQPKRPELGFNDNDILDEINALLTDFANATEKQAGVKVLNGRIVIRDGVATLYEGEERRLERVFDAEELGHLLWTAELFEKLNATEDAEKKQRDSLYALLRGVNRFDIDMERRIITFSPSFSPATPTPGLAPGTSSLVMRFEPIGTWSDEVWTWTYVHSKGPRAFVDARFSCPEICADRLARHTAVGLKAVGMYRAPYKSVDGQGFVYLALFVD